MCGKPAVHPHHWEAALELELEPEPELVAVAVLVLVLVVPVLVLVLVLLVVAPVLTQALRFRCCERWDVEQPNRPATSP